MTPCGSWSLTAVGDEITLLFRDTTGDEMEIVEGLTHDELIALRDHLLRVYPLEGWASPGAVAAVAEYASHRERRERIATAVLAGLAADPGTNNQLVSTTARVALQWADALIKRLELDEAEP